MNMVEPPQLPAGAPGGGSFPNPGGGGPYTNNHHAQQQQQQHHQQQFRHPQQQHANPQHANHALHPHHKSTTGRKGDPRMHRAVAARLADPSLTLFQALVMGGFDYTVDDYTDSSCTDSDHVTLAQRKNQLSRRLRLAKRQSMTPSAVQCKAVAAAAAQSGSASHHHNHHNGVSVGVPPPSAPAKPMASDTSTNSTNDPSSLLAMGTGEATTSQQQQPMMQNQGLAEMLRQQRESFRLLQQQQLEQQYASNNSSAAGGGSRRSSSQQQQSSVRPINNSNVLGAPNSKTPSWWNDQLQAAADVEEEEPDSPRQSLASSTATKAKDHPQFHPIVVSRIAHTSGDTRPLAPATAPAAAPLIPPPPPPRHSHTGTSTEDTLATSLQQQHPQVDDTAQNDMFASGQQPQDDPSLNAPPTKAAERSSQAAAAYTATATATATSSSTPPPPSGLALHSLTNTAQSLGMTLELFALALSSADTTRLSAALFQPPPETADASTITMTNDDVVMGDDSKKQSVTLDKAVNNNKDEKPLTRQEELALQLHMHETKTLYSKCMLLAGFDATQAAEDTPFHNQFAITAWEREGQRLQEVLRTCSSADTTTARQEGKDGEGGDDEQQQQQRQDTKDAGSNHDDDHDHEQPASSSGSSKRKREDDNASPAGTGDGVGADEHRQQRPRLSTGSSDTQQQHGHNHEDPHHHHPQQQQQQDQNTAHAAKFCAGLHMHRLEGKCGHTAIVHKPKDGEAHIDFVVGSKVECYGSLRPLQATTTATVSDGTCCDEDGAIGGGDGRGVAGECAKTSTASTSLALVDGDGSTAAAPTSESLTPLLQQNTTIWPSQFKCEDLSCKNPCSSLKPVLGSGLDGTSTTGTTGTTEQQDATAVAAVAATTDAASGATEQAAASTSTGAALALTTAANIAAMTPQILDVNDIDWGSDEWNADLNDEGFLGLFKLGDMTTTATAATATAASPSAVGATVVAAEPVVATKKAPVATKTARAAHVRCGGKKARQLQILQEHLRDPPPAAHPKKKTKHSPSHSRRKHK